MNVGKNVFDTVSFHVAYVLFRLEHPYNYCFVFSIIHGFKTMALFAFESITKKVCAMSSISFKFWTFYFFSIGF